ncbi:TetR/AcrR family transcriptional regulator [Vibrio sp. HN007]|uniref:TetR/AcrR family transcriptional regulator n=1 Tax=Vibrio iocasae TaxID=3098914 RepID=UPI0035D5193F
MPRVSQEVAKLTRQRIIDVSIKIVTLEGGESLTFSNIAKKAEISRSGINCHFKKKEDLLDEIRPELAKRLEQALDFSSPELFFETWTLAVDHDRMFRNLLNNLGFIINSQDGAKSLANKINGGEEDVMAVVYKAIGYAVVNA